MSQQSITSRLAVVTVLLTLGSPPWLPSQQRTVALSTPQAAFDEPFTAIRGVRELSDGRVLVSDLRDKIVMLVDFNRGAGTNVGREGQGPGEYSLPASLFPLPGGKTLLQDYGNQRFLNIGPDGSPGEILSPPRPAGGNERGGFMMIGAFLSPRGSDAAGNLYFQGSAFPATEGGESLDSVPIVRWDRATKIDTAGWIPLLQDARPQVTRSGNSMNVRMGGGTAWPARVEWGIAPDGRIALVSPEPFRVTWLTPRGVVAGPPVPYTPLKVTEAEKKEYRDQMSRATPIMMTIGGPGGGGRAVSSPQIEIPEPEWPTTMPPFTGGDAVQVTPEGDVWVARTRKASDKTPRYDVFDRTGRRTGEVQLRPRSRVVGFGKGVVYVVRMDEDDLQYLERFAR